MRLIWIVVASGLLWCGSTSAWACSSCGSGGDDPLILYPNEKLKFYTSATDESGLRNIRGDGVVSPSYGIIRRQKLLFAAGYLATFNSFFTLNIPYTINHSATRQRQGLSDIAVAWRYTFLPSSLATPYLPQAQLIAGHKFKNARGIDESRDIQNLDVFGTGFNESKIGIDTWSGMNWFQYGITYLVIVPTAKETGRGKQHPGLKDTAVVSVGHTTDHVRIVTGVTRYRSSQRTVDGDLVAHSEQLQHNIFATLQSSIDMMRSWRLTVVRNASWGENRNTARGTAVTLAYQWGVGHDSTLFDH